MYQVPGLHHIFLINNIIALTKSFVGSRLPQRVDRADNLQARGWVMFGKSYYLKKKNANKVTLEFSPLILHLPLKDLNQESQYKMLKCRLQLLWEVPRKALRPKGEPLIKRKYQKKSSTNIFCAYKHFFRNALPQEKEFMGIVPSGHYGSMAKIVLSIKIHFLSDSNTCWESVPVK